MKDYKIGRVVEYAGELIIVYIDPYSNPRKAKPSKALSINDAVIGYVRDDGYFEVIHKIQIRNIDYDRIAWIVCDFINSEPEILLNKLYDPIYPEDLSRKTRIRSVVVARQLTQLLYRFITYKTLTKIGKNIGGKDHSTVLHSIKTMLREISTNELFRSRIQGLLDKITGTGNIKLVIQQQSFNTCQI